MMHFGFALNIYLEVKVTSMNKESHKAASFEHLRCLKMLTP